MSILLGDPLAPNDEVNSFRNTMKRLREKAQREMERKQKEEERIQQSTAAAAGESSNDNGPHRKQSDGDAAKRRALPPVYIHEEVSDSELAQEFFIKVHLPNDELSKTVKCSGRNTANGFISQFIQKINATFKTDRQVDDFIIKVTGLADFLYGDYYMIQFEHIRGCIKQNKPIEINILPVEEVIQDQMHGESDAPVSQSYYDLHIEEGLSHSEIGFDRVIGRDATANGDEDDEDDDDAFDIEDMDVISMWDLHNNFRVRIAGSEFTRWANQPKKPQKGASEDEPYMAYVLGELYYGDSELAEGRFTKGVLLSESMRWNQWLTFDIKVSELPKESRLCLTVFVRPYNKKDGLLKTSDVFNITKTKKRDQPIAWVNCKLVDHRGILKVGKLKLKMWCEEKRANPIGTCVENLVVEQNAAAAAAAAAEGSSNTTQPPPPQPTTLYLELDQYCLPVVFPSGPPPESMLAQYKEQCRMDREMLENSLDKTAIRNNLVRVFSTDPLYKLTPLDKLIMWCYRTELKTIKQALPKVLLSVNWKNHCAVHEMYSLLDQWSPITPIAALELLGSNFPDARVREYAINRLNQMPDNELSEFILQLSQTLKYEPNHDSVLVRLMLQRAIKSPHIIGHILFWHLKAEMEDLTVRERHYLILEEFLRNCGQHRRELLKQLLVETQLLSIALKIKTVPKPDRASVLHAELEKLKLPPRFKLPLSPRLECKGIHIEKCKVMSSKKMPLWLVFENADQTGKDKNIYVIFKAGDDLRQDQLTLQILKIMDKLWKNARLDLKLIPYGCIATRDGVGMIEVVTSADTIANITKARGGASAAFSVDPIDVWLRAHNRPEMMPSVIDLFIQSCAGYCVATYVLGIGDRHNDNIMLTYSGNLFHIDFGHFLGNFKTKFGIQRETAPFVFTPMYAYAMGGEETEEFKRFVKLSGQAYNLLRKNSHTLMNLFQLMLSTGIPELQSADDIQWLRNSLSIGMSDDEAAKHFADLVKVSLGTVRTRINDAIHIWAHK